VLCSPSEKFDHLVCYFPGTLALLATGGKRIKDPTKELTLEQQEDLYLAKELAASCYEMYHQTPTGLAPEIGNSVYLYHNCALHL
jgi:endoplasmic reticulum Man9GlcNAc2 1,2-alpha-mannosidase